MALIGLAFLLMHCNNEDPNSTPTVPVNYGCTDNPTACELTTANNQLGFKVFKELHKEDTDKNIFISPLSISTALAMTLNGAATQTYDDMQSTMELSDLSKEEINQAYQYVLNALPLLDEAIDLKLANSIWHDLAFSANAEFLGLNEEFFNSEVAALDFKSPSAKEEINDWVERNTDGLIKEIIKEIPSGVVMYLINAIYFKGSWKEPFKEERTEEEDFILADNSTTTVPMMAFEHKMELPYFSTETFQAVDLAYADSIFSMSLFLPNTTADLDQVINELETDSWENWINSFSDQEIVFSMPKFKMEYEKKLNDVLKQLGMEIAFNGGQADFSNIGPGGLFISEVRHKSFVEVNEKGTEAAAVTSVAVTDSAGGFVKLNRPFLFVIRENKTNSVLFIGKMMNPNE